MSILTANLKHFYQRRGLWLWYVVFATQCPMVFTPVWLKGQGNFAAYLVLSFFIGALVGVLVRDVLNKAFAYCLPGHNEIPRRLLLRIGIVVNVLMGLIWLCYPKVSFPYSVVVAAGGAAGGLVTYWAGVLLSMSFSNTLSFVALIPLLVIVSGWVGADKPLEATIAAQPIGLIAAGAAVTFYMWQRLGKAGLSRKYCAQAYLGPLDMWNTQKMNKYRKARALKKMEKSGGSLLDRLHGFFTARMGGAGRRIMGRYAWGNIYAIAGNLASTARFVQIMGGFVFLVIWFGYFASKGRGHMEGFVFLVPAFAGIHLDLAGSRSMLLGRGREEMYQGAIWSGVIATLFTTLFVCGVAAASEALKPVMPEINLRGASFSYDGINWRYFHVTLIAMPATLAIGTVLRHQTVLKMVILIAFMQVCILPWIFFSGLTIPFAEGLKGLVIAVSWLGSWYVLRRHCIRGDLVGAKD